MKSWWVYLIIILYCGFDLLKEIGVLLRRKDKLMLSSCLHFGHFIWRKPLVVVILYATILLQEEQRISTFIGFEGRDCRGGMICVTAEGLTCWTMEHHSLRKMENWGFRSSRPSCSIRYESADLEEPRKSAIMQKASNLFGEYFLLRTNIFSPRLWRSECH